MATAEQRRARKRAIRREQLARQQYIAENKPKFNEMWKSIMGRRITDAEMNKMLGNPSNAITRELLARSYRYERYQNWQKNLVSRGVKVKKFKDGDNADKFYNGLISKYGTINSLNAWLTRAATFKAQNPNSRRNLFATANAFRSKYKTIEKYDVVTTTAAQLAGYSSEVQKAFGNRLKEALRNPTKYGDVLQEALDYQEILDVLNAEGMTDQANALNRNRAAGIMRAYGSANGYSRFLGGADQATIDVDRFKEVAGFDLTDLPTVQELQQQRFEGQGGQIETELAEFENRLKYLKKGTQQQSTIQGDPSLGKGLDIGA